MTPAFPLVLSNGPPPDGLAEVARGGANLLRTGLAGWNERDLDAQLAGERAKLDTAASHGLSCWVWLGGTTNVPAGGGSTNERLLRRIVTALRNHPALAAWKGHDEPRNPFHPSQSVPPANLVRGKRIVSALDPKHPLVIVQAPRGPVAELVPYRSALDIAGVDIYPISFPPQVHSDRPERDIGVVGDLTRWIGQAAGTKPVWVTLQVAWSGVIPTRARPGIVPRLPSYPELRFMAHQAIVQGARGLVFFGGHLTEVCSPSDAAAGWNWTFWRQVLQPLLQQLSSTALAPALVAPASRAKVRAQPARDVELVARQNADFLYVIAVRRGGGTTQVRFTGLPAKLKGGQVLFEYAQDPPPPPVAPAEQRFRSVAVTGGAFRDWLAPHDVRVYRFAR